MSTTKPISLFLCFALTLLLALCFFASATDSDLGDVGVDADLDGIEELIAVDNEEEETQNRNQEEGSYPRPSSETEVVSRAQRIVLELNSDNANDTIEGNKFVLVLGYAPWDARSAELMPRFAEAANSLKELGSPILMAKIDSERHPKAASVLGIKGLPTLLLFVNGFSQSYTGGLSSDEIVIWARKKTGVPVIRLSSIVEAEEFLKRYSTFVIGCFEKFEGPNYQEFVRAATSDNQIQFVEMSDTKAAKALYPDFEPSNQFIGLVKSDPERYTAFEGSFEASNILEFVDYNKFPLVMILTELNSIKVYSSPIKLQVMVFTEVNNFQKLLEPFQNVARKFKTKILFMFVDVRDDNLAKPYLTLFGLEESKETMVTAFHYTGSSKYLLESDPSPRNVEEFCLGLLRGTLTQHFKSQAAPDNENATVLTIVGKTFDEFILNSCKNVLLEVHTPWCISCEATSKQIEKLAKHFKGQEDLVFARIDASENEHPKLQVYDYPTLLFYPADNKSNPIKLYSKSNLKDMAVFIKTNMKSQDQPTKDEL